MKLYKLTDQDGYTQRNRSGETLWTEGKTVELPTKPDPELCSSDVIHAYEGINLGLLLNPIHASIHNPKLWKCEGDVVVSDWGKVGCLNLTILCTIPLPDWYSDLKIRQKVQIQFAVLCAETVIHRFEEQFPNDSRPREAILAAKTYLENKEINDVAQAAGAAARAAADAAGAAAYAAYAAARAAARAATYVAADAAGAAAYAAYAAARAAADAADAAAREAADAAYAAARAAARAATYVAADGTINMLLLADEAVKMITDKED